VPGNDARAVTRAPVARLARDVDTSAFVGELVNAEIIVVIVSLSVAVNFTQTFRSRKAADQLRATVAPTATVLRDGAFAEAHRADVVPGDVIRLSAELRVVLLRRGIVRPTFLEPPRGFRRGHSLGLVCRAHSSAVARLRLRDATGGSTPVQVQCKSCRRLAKSV
jgi:hypothetical protein